MKKISKSQRGYVESELARVEADRCHASLSAEEISAVLRDFESLHADVRANALRSVCPCHVPWEVFDQVRKAAQRLRKDPSPLVRHLVLHLEDDVREVAQLEALRERIADREADMADYAHSSKKKRRRR